jgi:hypothetical protein
MGFSYLRFTPTGSVGSLVYDVESIIWTTDVMIRELDGHYKIWTESDFRSDVQRDESNPSKITKEIENLMESMKICTVHKVLDIIKKEHNKGNAEEVKRLWEVSYLFLDTEYNIDYPGEWPSDKEGWVWYLQEYLIKHNCFPKDLQVQTQGLRG